MLCRNMSFPWRHLSSAYQVASHWHAVGGVRALPSIRVCIGVVVRQRRRKEHNQPKGKADTAIIIIIIWHSSLSDTLQRLLSCHSVIRSHASGDRHYPGPAVPPIRTCWSLRTYGISYAHLSFQYPYMPSRHSCWLHSPLILLCALLLVLLCCCIHVT